MAKDRSQDISQIFLNSLYLFISDRPFIIALLLCGTTHYHSHVHVECEHVNYFDLIFNQCDHPLAKCSPFNLDGPLFIRWRLIDCF